MYALQRLHDITGEAYQRGNRAIEQVFNNIKCLESFGKHDIDRNPRVYQDSSYFKVSYVSFHDQWVVMRVDDTSFFLRVETYWILIRLLMLASPDVFHVKHLVARP
ncbi:hypothetical protein ACFX1X_035241 [Malus domestica]